MSAPRRLIAFLLVANALFSSFAQIQPPGEIENIHELFLPGQILAPTALPTGEILLTCADQTLNAVSKTGILLSTWKAQDRWAFPAAVSPRSGLIAVSTLSGTFDILSWDKTSKTFKSVFRFSHSTLPSAAPAWDVRGFVHAAWKDGTVETWTAEGRLWERHASPNPVLTFVCDESRGTIEGSSGTLTIRDTAGRALTSSQFEGDPLDAAVDQKGDLWILTSQSVLKQPSDSSSFQVIWTGTNLQSMSVVSGAFVLVQSQDRLVKIDSSGQVLSFSIPGRPVAPCAVDRRGSFWVPTQTGLWLVGWTGRVYQKIGSAICTTAPLVTADGILVWGTSSWKTQFLNNATFLSLNWQSQGGDPQRSRQARLPIDLNQRMKLWEGQGDFQLLRDMVDSFDHERQRTALETLEKSDKQGTLEKDFPFANVILLKIVRSGLTDLKMDRGHILNDWPDLRVRAYNLLTKYAVLEDRDELLDLLGKEYDSNAYPAAISALGSTLWDPDGRMLATFVQIQQKKGAQAGVSAALLDAAYRFWQFNGKNADSHLVELLTLIYQSQSSRSVRVRAQSFLQEIVEAP